MTGGAGDRRLAARLAAAAGATALTALVGAGLLSAAQGGSSRVPQVPECRDGYVVAEVRTPRTSRYHTVCLTGYIP